MYLHRNFWCTCVTRMTITTAFDEGFNIALDCFDCQDDIVMRECAAKKKHGRRKRGAGEDEEITKSYIRLNSFQTYNFQRLNNSTLMGIDRTNIGVLCACENFTDRSETKCSFTRIFGSTIQLRYFSMVYLV